MEYWGLFALILSVVGIFGDIPPVKDWKQHLNQAMIIAWFLFGLLEFRRDGVLFEPGNPYEDLGWFVTSMTPLSARDAAVVIPLTGLVGVGLWPLVKKLVKKCGLLVVFCLPPKPTEELCAEAP